MSYDDRYDQPQEAAPDPLTNIDAEAALLGGMLLDNALISDLADRLRVDDFAEPLHGRIYNTLLRFSAKGAKANATALKPIFARDEEALHGAYLDQLVENPATLIGAADFADQILALSDRRVTRAALAAAQESLLNDFDMPITEIASRVETAAYAASERQTDRPLRTLADMVGLAQERVRRVQEDHEQIGMTNMLVPDLDAVLGPLETGYHILAGRAGMGKTTLAHSAALGYAAHGWAGVYASAEMTPEQLGMRAAVDLGFALGYRIKHDDLKRGRLTPEQVQQLKRTAERAALIPLEYVDVRGANIRRVWSEVARRRAYYAAQGKKLSFVVIDYLGLFSADIDGKPIEDDRKRMNFISRFVLHMAAALDVAVIALAQVSRGVEGRVNKRPMLQDLKETGNLEQDADSVSFVYREEYYLEQSKPKQGERDEKRNVDLYEVWEIEMRAARNKVEIIGAKNRHGANITKECNFFGEYYAIRARGVLDIGDTEAQLAF